MFQLREAAFLRGRSKPGRGIPKAHAPSRRLVAAWRRPLLPQESALMSETFSPRQNVRGDCSFSPGRPRDAGEFRSGPDRAFREIPGGDRERSEERRVGKE